MAEGDNNNPEKKKFKYEIHIGITEEGQMAVRDNLGDMVIAKGMLEVAKDIITNKILKASQSNIIQPKGGILNFARRRK